ncbi:GldG family protein [soil metagenome]
MKNKSASTALNLFIVAAILVAVNYIVGALGFLNFRADLTEKKIFTLSEGSRQVVSKLNPDKPVTIRFYATRDSRLMPQWVQSYATTVEDLLLEFQKASEGKITLEKIDPRPDTEAEDRAVGDDIQGHTMSAEGGKAYFGLAIQSLQQKEIISALDPREEASLEYNIARSLAKVSNTKRSVIGVMSSMPIAGPAMNFPPMMQQRQQPPWMVIQQLKLDYDVREVPMSSEAIDADINILLVIHPSGITEKAEFAIDQFLLKGGKVMAMVDSQCLVSQAYNTPGQMGMAPTVNIGPTSDLKSLFKAWGVTYDQNSVVADMTYRTNTQGRAVPTFLTIDRNGINHDEPVCASLDFMQFFAPGALNMEKREGLAVTTLLQSSENSEMIDSAVAEKARSQGLSSFQASGKKQSLAVRLSGNFKTAFPDGPPKDKAPAPGAPKLPGEKGGEEKKDAGAPAPQVPDAKAAAKPAFLKESQNKDGVVFLFSDVDMFYDMFAFESDPGGRPVAIARNSNAPLLLNIVEMLSGGADLISVRSRAVTKRPFTKMEELRAQVESEYRPLIEQRNQKLTDIVQKIATLGGVKQEKGMVVLNINQEQRKQLVDEQNAIKKDIRDLQKEQNKKKDQRELIITALNMLAVPLLVIVFGLVIALRRRSLQAAH